MTKVDGLLERATRFEVIAEEVSIGALVVVQSHPNEPYLSVKRREQLMEGEVVAMVEGWIADHHAEMCSDILPLIKALAKEARAEAVSAFSEAMQR